MSRRFITGLVITGALIVLPVMASDHPVTYFSGEMTRAAFQKGQPLVETATYKVHASRREAPGQAEVHVRDTDIFYILEGTATLVTGGEAVKATSVAPDELRGPSIANGMARRVAQGDVIIIPNGTAHQFTEVSAPFLYYTVKVTSPPTGSSR
jgi:mannose-6-phosphate isomerase-like protein (cupin superfamily)